MAVDDGLESCRSGDGKAVHRQIAGISEPDSACRWSSSWQYCYGFSISGSDSAGTGFLASRNRVFAGFPSTVAAFEIVRNSDETISIRATNVDPVVSREEHRLRNPGLCHWRAADINNATPYLPTGTYNAELVVPLTPKMRMKLRSAGTAAAN
jgi:hypothetical protein